MKRLTALTFGIFLAFLAGAQVTTSPLVTGVGVDLSTSTVTGTLPVSKGGTGVVTLTGIPVGSGTAAFAAYAGTSCTNQFPRSLNASGAATCASVANADLAGSIAASKLVGTDIATVGTITSGAWTGTDIAFANIAQVATNTVLGNSTAGTADLAALAVGSCSTAGSALIWTTNTGFGCNTSIAANTATTATALASDPTDCAANNFATAIATSGNLTCAQPSISAGVSGLGGGVATALAAATQVSGGVAVLGGSPLDGMTQGPSQFKSGAWTPSPVNLTTTGTPTYTGTYLKLGNLVFITLYISAAGGTTAATMGSTSFSGMPYTTANDMPLQCIDVGAVQTITNRGYFDATSAYMPTWASNASDVACNGFYRTTAIF